MLNTADFRDIYQSILGRSISDSQWWRVRSAFKLAQLPITEENVRTFAILKRSSPRLKIAVSDLIEINTQINSYVIKAVTFKGCEIERIIYQDWKINPHQTTFCRWFSDIGGFNQHKSYRAADVAHVFICARVYLFKQRQNISPKFTPRY
jgi:hypothetical protein